MRLILLLSALLSALTGAVSARGPTSPAALSRAVEAAIDVAAPALQPLPSVRFRGASAVLAPASSATNFAFGTLPRYADRLKE